MTEASVALPLLSDCPVHGLFRSRLVSFAPGGGGTIDLRGNVETCPTCGRPSRVLDGKFLVRDGLTEIIEAPEFTRERLRHIVEILQAARETARTDPEAAVEAVAEVAPDTAGKLRELAKRHTGTAAKWVVGAVVSAMLGVVAQQVYDGAFGENHGVPPEVVRELIEEARRQSDIIPVQEASPPTTRPGPNREQRRAAKREAKRRAKQDRRDVPGSR